MNLSIQNKRVFEKYKSNSQRIRVLTESWFSSQMYCPCCLDMSINSFPNNQKGVDFFCKRCKNEFQLKSSKEEFSKRVLDGEYNTMKKIILENHAPNLFLLNYNLLDLHIKNLSLIPKFFVTFSILEKRKPLSSNAERAGWTGCNFIIDRLPADGKIKIIENERIIEKEEVNQKWNRMFFINLKNPRFRGWTSDILKIVEELPEKFSLEEAYKYEKYLKEIHPLNNNIRPKIRQQLQILRENKILEFLGKGIYKMKKI